MSTEIKNLEPKEVWEQFYALTQIPRPSKKEAKVIEFMKNFGESLGLKTIVDEVGNVIIKKPATPGFEDRKTVVLQGHIDMVPQANSDSNHNFETDPIDAYIDGDWVTALGTTLGADNGMGVAASMAVLASKTLQHGPIEGLFTIDEETGMTGAFGLKPGLLDGDILLNLDSEDEGELYVGCAGGEDASGIFTFTPQPVPANLKSYRVIVKGLKGGHSGLDIVLGRGNANKILFRFLNNAQALNIKVGDIKGGSLRNAIPREAFATIMVEANKSSKLEEMAKELNKTIKSELAETDAGVELTIVESDAPAFVIDEDTQKRLINTIMVIPNGVIRMSQSMKGMVETSTSLAIVQTTEENTIEVHSLMRSSVDSAKDVLGDRISALFNLAGAKAILDGAYPGWKPNMNSEILDIMQATYKDKWGKTPEIKAIHAGLECGLLGSVYPNWDMISFGPTIRFPHSPDEKVKIDTVQRFWEWLVETLKNIPKK